MNDLNALGDGAFTVELARTLLFNEELFFLVEDEPLLLVVVVERLGVEWRLLLEEKLLLVGLLHCRVGVVEFGGDGGAHLLPSMRHSLPDEEGRHGLEDVFGEAGFGSPPASSRESHGGHLVHGVEGVKELRDILAEGSAWVCDKPQLQLAHGDCGPIKKSLLSLGPRGGGRHGVRAGGEAAAGPEPAGGGEAAAGEAAAGEAAADAGPEAGGEAVGSGAAGPLLGEGVGLPGVEWEGVRSDPGGGLTAGPSQFHHAAFWWGSPRKKMISIFSSSHHQLKGLGKVGLLPGLLSLLALLGDSLPLSLLGLLRGRWSGLLGGDHGLFD